MSYGHGHFSLKKYLMSDRCTLQSYFQDGVCYKAMTEGCLRYLLHTCEKAPLTNDILDQYPLARYAAKYWSQHARHIKGTLGQTIVDLILSLLTRKSNLLTWVQLNVGSGREPKLSLSERDLAGPLYYPASTGLIEVAESLIQRDFDVNAQGGRHRSALAAAASGGHGKMVQMLLEAGADVNSHGRLHSSALAAASRYGHREIVHMLLDAGADVNSQGRNGDALAEASRFGHQEIVQILLDAGADVNSQGLFDSPRVGASPAGQ